jgi:choice-of-anchor A domain-containing protein
LAQSYGLVSNGNLTAKSGTIRGEIYHGGQMNVDSSVYYDHSKTFATMPIEFASASSALQGMSDTLNGYTPTGTTNISNGNIVLTATSPNLDVFAVEYGDLANTHSVTLNFPVNSFGQDTSTSTVIINVINTKDGGTEATFMNSGLEINGHDGGKILWNFNKATKVTISSIGFVGSILAPMALVNMQWGQISGTLVAKTIDSTSEFYYMPFQNNWLVPVTITPSPTMVYQINCGSNGSVWPFSADTYGTGGTTETVSNTISTTGVTKPAPMAVYQSERYGNSTYVLPNLVASAQYTIRLHFAEPYWTAAGKRVFNVVVNGTTRLSNLDIYSAAGGQYKALVKEITGTANALGQIVISFNTVTNNASIGGIELIQN